MSANEANRDGPPSGAVFGREPSGRVDITEAAAGNAAAERERERPDLDDTEEIEDETASVPAEPVPAAPQPGEPAEPEPEPEPVQTELDDSTATAEQALVGDELEERWDAAKIAFVDEPRQAVERAAELVNEALSGLEERWRDGEDTEVLRTAFQHYRAVFDAVRL
jgi:hypothetical protein